jgi:hypothetical protein
MMHAFVNASSGTASFRLTCLSRTPSRYKRRGVRTLCADTPLLSRILFDSVKATFSVILAVDDMPAGHLDHARAVRHQLARVGHHHNGDAQAGMQIAEQLHDL